MNTPLLSALQDPSSTQRFSAKDWESFLTDALLGRLAARLFHVLQAEDLQAVTPPAVWDRLVWADRLTVSQQRAIRWECRQVARALADLGEPLILLKGAAYSLAALPNSRGRIFGDLDILVPKSRLAEVEQRILAAGWKTEKDDPYDQRYYREWMHELPPFQHVDRQTALDVHHTILPITGRVNPDANALIRDAIPTSDSRFRILCPTDMVLHASAHLFQDGEIAGALRELVDIGDLLSHFGTNEAFWRELSQRAALHGLERSLFYAVRYSKRVLKIPLPDWELGQPKQAILRAMDLLVESTLLPSSPDLFRPMRDSAAILLQLRSHALKMPLRLLAPHLWHKLVKRFEQADEEEPQV